MTISAKKGNFVISYAQNREDVILSAFFKNKNTGYYVDIGANHPNNATVTKYFYDRGWRGMNIEPIAFLFDKLKQYRPNDINLNIGIANKNGSLSFREYEGLGLSTFSNITKKELENARHPLAKQHIDYEVIVRKLSDVLESYNVKNIDFMNIDVEGYEYEVIASNNWRKFRPKVICIEVDHMHKDWHPLLESNNYSLIFNDGLNDYMVDNYQFNSNDFDYIESVIGRKIISNDFAEDYNSLQREKRKLELKFLDLKDEISELKLKNNELSKVIANSKRLRGSARLLYKSIDNAINVQLNKIDHGGIKSNTHNLPKINLSQLAKKTKKDAIEEVRICDEKVLPLTQNISYEINRSMAYKATSYIYGKSKKASKYLLKSGYKSMKKIKKGANK